MGEKAVTCRTPEAYSSMLKMEATDAQKPLLSVSRVCEVGHRVVFHSRRGYIQHDSTGQITTFFRDNNVCRMEVMPMLQPTAGFRWQGE